MFQAAIQNRKGNCWDNALTESLWGSLKVGRLYGMRFETRRQAMDEVIDWLMYYKLQKASLDAGLYPPDAVRAKLVYGTVEGCRIMCPLRDADYRGKVKYSL